MSIESYSSHRRREQLTASSQLRARRAATGFSSLAIFVSSLWLACDENCFIERELLSSMLSTMSRYRNPVVLVGDEGVARKDSPVLRDCCASYCILTFVP